MNENQNEPSEKQVSERNREKPLLPANDIKRNIRRIFFLFFVLFGLLVIYLAKYILIDSGNIITNSYNPRLKLEDSDVLRGKILDSNEKVLAEGNSDDRKYPYGNIFAHLVGSVQMGKLGVEGKYNFQLEHPHWEVAQRLMGLFNGQKTKADSVVLTVDADLQKLVYKALDESKGAVVIIEPSTGKILSMVSYPDFRPDTLTDNWKQLKEDTENSKLLNRATQGLYPPGSVFKVITAAAAMESIPNYKDYTFDCKGEAIFNGERIRCFDSNAHGVVDLKKAFTVSCNTYFSSLGLKVGAKKLIEVCERAGFNKSLDYPLEYSVSSFALKPEANTGQIIQTAIGQGETQVTPLNMAMIVSAIANNGLMMAPYVVEKYKYYDGAYSKVTLPKPVGQVFSEDEANELTNMMVSVVENGTGKAAAVKGLKIAIKTGTAQNPLGADHGWVIAFAPADNPKIAMAIALENSGGPRKALAIVKKVMSTYLKQ